LARLTRSKPALAGTAVAGLALVAALIILGYKFGSQPSSHAPSRQVQSPSAQPSRFPEGRHPEVPRSRSIPAVSSPALNQQLLEAANRGDIPGVRNLLSQGAEVNARSSIELLTPLHVAVIRNAPALAAALLDQGADVNAKDGSGRTPLELAESRNLAQMQALLRSRGARASGPEPPFSPPINQPNQSAMPPARGVPPEAVSPPAFEPAGRIRPNPWSGVWRINQAQEITLFQSGNRVNGFFDNNHGRITGVVSGNSLQGSWEFKNEQGSLEIRLWSADTFNGTMHKNALDRNRFRSSFAWAGQRLGEPPAHPPEPEPGPARAPPTQAVPPKPREFPLTIKAVGVPLAGPCRITLTLPDAPQSETVEPEFQRSYSNGAVVRLEAPNAVAGVPFDRWENADAAQHTTAWITNDYSRSVTARYRAWQGAWKTSKGYTLTLSQAGNLVAGKDSQSNVTLKNGVTSEEGQVQQLRAMIEDSHIYDLRVTMEPDCKHFSGTLRQRKKSSIDPGQYAAEEISAERLPSDKNQPAGSP
jgi:hypothetical protein